jgi:hypothetical protein
MKLSLVLAAGAAIAVGVSSLVPAAEAAHGPGYEPVLNPADFVKVIDNPYFPLPVGRTLIYRGIKDGRSQVDRVHVTSKTKKIEGIAATTVTDVSTHRGKLLEKTTDWYAQDKHGTVWNLRTYPHQAARTGTQKSPRAGWAAAPTRCRPYRLGRAARASECSSARAGH